MIDWSASMSQTYEFYIVDPDTWVDKERIQTIKTASISRDSEAETLGSASFDLSEMIGECYIRTYLIANQNGIEYREPLGTYIVQTPSSNFNGKTTSYSVNAYTPLLELKEKLPQIGYYLPKETNIMSSAYRLIKENLRAPVVETESDKTLVNDFVANSDDTWMSFVTDLINNAEYTLDIDSIGRVLFSPKQDTSSLAPIWTYTDDNSSILYPEINIDKDMYGIPNVIEVLYSSQIENDNNDYTFYTRIVNDDANSPISTINRGREIVKRITNPELSGEVTQKTIDEYAKRMLQRLSTLEYTITYTHAYCPVRVGDCVRLEYSLAGVNGVKAKVVSQTITCEPGCPVSESAVVTAKLWG